MGLSSQTGELIISDEKWCEVTARLPSIERTLGSDERAVLIQRLRAILAAESLEPTAGEIDGVPVAWITSFAEKHGSLYAAAGGHGLRIFAQDAEGNTVGEFVLASTDRKRSVV